LGEKEQWGAGRAGGFSTLDAVKGMEFGARRGSSVN